MYHVTRHGQWETGGHLSTHFLLLDKASPASHSLVPNRELWNLRYTNTHTRVHRGALAGEKVVYRSGKTQKPHLGLIMGLRVRLHPSSLTPKCSICSATQNTQLEEKVGHGSAFFLKKASSEHVLLPGEDSRRKRWPTPNQNGYVHTRVTSSTRLYVKAMWLDEFCKWHVFTLREEKPALRYLVLGNWALQCFVTLSL